MRVQGPLIGANETTASVGEGARANGRGAGSPGRAETASAVVSRGATELAASVARGRAAVAERVEEVRARLDAGTYRVDLDRLAERMLDDELGRLGRR